MPRGAEAIEASLALGANRVTIGAGEGPTDDIRLLLISNRCRALLKGLVLRACLQAMEAPARRSLETRSTIKNNRSAQK